MSAQLNRIISTIALFFGTFVCGVAPAFIKWYLSSGTNITTRRASEQRWIIKQSKMITSFFMCFGGGVLFATCFIHLLPELRNTFEDYWEKDRVEKNTTRGKHIHSKQHSHRFPLPEFIMCGGFLFVFAMEEVIYYVVCKLHNGGPLESAAVVSQCKKPSSTETSPKEESDELIESDNNKVMYGTLPETSEENNHTQPIKTQLSYPSAMTTHDSKLILFKSGLSLRGILAVIALSFHSLFEGLSVGMQRTGNEIWTMFFAVAMHKFVIAAVIGVETVQAGTSIKTVIPYMLVFSLMSPIGMMTAMLTYGTMVEEDELISGSLIAVATGTLMYVTFFEILLKERNSELPGNFQLLGMFLGFITMTLIDSCLSNE